MSGAKITIIHDALGQVSSLKKDWGFSAHLDFDGRRILFDTGNDAETFSENCSALGLDLRNLDYAVISHRRGDHTSGLNHLLKVNPKLTVYTQRGATMFTSKKLGCSFCGKSASEVAKLVAGPSVFICDVCAAEAHRIMSDPSIGASAVTHAHATPSIWSRVYAWLTGHRSSRGSIQVSGLEPGVRAIQQHV